MVNTVKNEEGVVILITILSVGLFAMALAMTLALNAASQVAKNTNAHVGDKLFYTADAQAREGVYQFLNNTDPTSYTGGDSFDLNGSTGGSLSAVDIGWPYYEITSKSTNGSIERSIIYTVTVFPAGQSFDHAVFANEDLTVSGSVEINGDMFSNGNLDFNGNPPINGDVYSGGTADESNNNVSGETYSDVDPIPAPDVNLDFYRNEAQANGTYFTSATDGENYIDNSFTDGETVFVEDATGQMNIDETLTGSIVTTGDLRVNGGEYTASDDHFAIIVMGDMRMAGNATVNGVVYVAGETTFSGGGATINGTLISAQGVEETGLTGNVTINYDPTYIFVTEDNTTTDEDPVITNWREE